MKPNHVAHRIKPASDTDLDEVLYQATLEDSSLSADGEVDLATELSSEFDFGSLPSVTELNPNSVTHFRGSAIAPLVPSSIKASANPSSGNSSSGNPSSGNPTKNNHTTQTLLLGIGLAIASIALIAVIGLGLHAVLRPPVKERPRIKMTEQGKGKSPIVVYQQ